MKKHPALTLPSRSAGVPKKTLALLMPLFGLLHAASAAPATTNGDSSASGASIQVSVLGLVDSNSGTIGSASGAAPAPYSNSQTAVPLNFNPGLSGLLDPATTSGTIDVAASSTVDGAVGTRTTNASSTVENLSLDLAQVVGSQPLVGLDAPNVVTTVSITGEPGSYVSTPHVSLAGMTLKVLGADIDLTGIDLNNVEPNTAVDLGTSAVTGLSIILNETVTTGSALGGFRTESTAIRIRLNAVNLGLINVLNGDIVIGRASAAEGRDSDGDGLYNGLDGDSDGDGIPDSVEIANAGPGGDTDGDGAPDQMDLDSDNDGINDVIEGGGKDTNGDGRQDPSGDANPDEDGDGIVDSADPDDNVLGGGKGTALAVPDTDGDGARNYVDVDSDNDSLSDLVESGQSSSGDTSGVLPVTDTDGDGISNSADGSASFGDAPGGASPPLPDSDNDGIANAYETDSDNNGSTDISGTPSASLDGNGDGRIDSATDGDGDGIPNVVDNDPTHFGGLANPNGDADGDGTTNGIEGLGLVDTDGDGVSDQSDADSDADGIPDATETYADFDGDGAVNARDLDSDNDGINDVIEGAGLDANGDGRQDASADGVADEDGDGMVDTVDSDDSTGGGGYGVALTVPDSDGDGARDYLDLDSDNDTLSDLVESGLGVPDANDDGIGEGADADHDGIVASADGLPGAFGDASGSTPIDTDGDGIPNYRDPNSDGAGAMDIVMAGNGGFDGNGDGKVDNATDADGDGIPDNIDADDFVDGGLGFGLLTYDEWVIQEFEGAEETNPAISGENADPDNDGYTNAEEFAFGSDPENPASVPNITTAPGGGGGAAVVVTAQKNPNAYAFVYAQASRDLQAWSSAPNILTVNVDNPTQMAAQVGEVLGEEDSDKGFIRFVVVIP